MASSKVRVGQLITGYGIGAITSTVDGENLLVLAMKHWGFTQEERPEIIDDNLRAALGVRRIVSIRENENRPLVRKNITALRMPSWHYCVYCHHMTQVSKRAQMLERCSNSECKSKAVRKSTLIPVRLLTICKKGHLSDFPFQEVVHGPGSNTADHQLIYETNSGRSGFSGVKIKCKTCEKSTSLGGVLSFDYLTKKGFRCNGELPWLIDGQNQNCGADPIAVQKASSNIYFPLVMNSIYVPRSSEVYDERVLKFFEGASNFEIIKNFSGMPGWNSDMLWKVALNLQGDSINGFQENDDEIKHQLWEYFNHPPVKPEGRIQMEEYKALVKSPKVLSQKDFKVMKHDMEEYDLKNELAFKVDSIVLVERLKDTRAFCGFTRVMPKDELLGEGEEEELSLENIIRRSYGSTNEVLAHEVRGEGVFIKFAIDPLIEWSSREDVKREFSRLPDTVCADMGENLKNPIVFMLLHSLSHSLIYELSQVAGYSSTSIRERIYVDKVDEDENMAGILIYTADSDGEGSLGGLVRLGKPGLFEDILDGAIERNGWCSGDPICSEYGHQGPTSRLLAACHNCLILPETSCAHYNEFLNRLFVNSEWAQEDIGYFKN